MSDASLCVVAGSVAVVVAIAVAGTVNVVGTRAVAGSDDVGTVAGAVFSASAIEWMTCWTAGECCGRARWHVTQALVLTLKWLLPSTWEWHVVQWISIPSYSLPRCLPWSKRNLPFLRTPSLVSFSTLWQPA